MFGLLIAPLYTHGGEPLSWACYSRWHPNRSPWGLRVNRWWRRGRWPERQRAVRYGGLPADVLVDVATGLGREP